MALAGFVMQADCFVVVLTAWVCHPAWCDIEMLQASARAGRAKSRPNQ